MNITLKDCANKQLAVRLVDSFLEDLPDGHVSCAYQSGVYKTFIKRTKAGNIIVQQWRS